MTKKSVTLLLILLLPIFTVSASDNTQYQIPKTQVVPIKDSVSGGQYELYIKLPDGYLENADTDYPVIYFTDAVWHIEILSASTEYLMENAILVGISWQKDVREDLRQEAGMHVSRYSDYSIRKSTDPQKQAKYQFGKAGAHLKFIRNDVVKYIEDNYRTQSDNRTYFGYSLGGLFGAYILMVQPDTFKNYILGSPALRGDLPLLSELSEQSKLKNQILNANVYISHGSQEAELAKLIDQFMSTLTSRNNESLALNLDVNEGDHGSAFPLTGVRAITWLSKLSKKEDKK